MAAFMLHQAAEQALIILLKLNTGLHVTTHNLDKLYRYCCLVCYKLPEIVFGNNKQMNTQLFYLLQRAYVEARYKNDYNINTPDLLEFAKIVNRLHILVKNIRETHPLNQEVVPGK